MKKNIVLFILNLIISIVFIFAFLTTCNNFRYIDKNDIITGKISKVNLLVNGAKGSNIYAYEFEINNKRDKKYLTVFERLDYNIKIGDNIISKNLYIGNTNSKILSINGDLINNYYSFFDFSMLILLIIIILSYYYYFKIIYKRKYKNKAEEYNLKYKRKNNRNREFE